MNSLIHLALFGLAPHLETAADFQACAKAVGATTTATRLAELPPTVRDQLIQRVLASGGRLADSGTKLIETDAPTEADRQHANERFEGGMLTRGRWFVQVKQGLFAGVVTYTYVRQKDGNFSYSPEHSFRGPSCASIQAALAGVTTAQGL